MNPPKEPPPGCIEIPGFIVECGKGLWLSQDGLVTDKWSERGVWATQADAEAVAGKLRNEVSE